MTTEPSDAAIGAAYGMLFEGIDRLGPGSTATRQGLVRRLAPGLRAAPRIADMGCGAGAATVDLALAFPDAVITAIDNHGGFLAGLRERALAMPASITAFEADMAAPPMRPGSLDLIWCESAIYSVGRSTALAAWRPLLSTGGRVAFSDVVWTDGAPPAEARAFWAAEYPAMATTAGVEAEVADGGYDLVDRSVAPRSDWQDYYAPLRARLEALAPDADEALELVLGSMRREIAVFDAFADSYASVWFIVRPVA